MSVKSVKYVNQQPTSMSTSVQSMLAMIRDYARMRTQLRPQQQVPIVPISLSASPDERVTRVAWFGHSASLLEIEGKRILLDPMLGPASSPFPIFNSKRYSGGLPVKAEAIGQVDAIFLSHNHFDHMDRGSIKKLESRVGHFHVPSGVGRYLQQWGIEESRISEHGWWDEFEFKGLKIACTPARHFSGRGLTDRDRSLWCSWVFKGQSASVFFSGDSGYAPHFKDIGDKYGPFDLTLMECGQYDERWSAIHMMPEETVQAHRDVRGDVLVPIHWGAFTLALHAWTDPVERAVAAAVQHGVTIATPRIGEFVAVSEDKTQIPAAAWWR
ncbi:outer membrane protein RomA [Paenibacillus curdlanolyticus YK9]|uniref:Outer membrane protein RomA n=1 Tax=Paenibacillus curdlanolyticus YK9 TaxID=717606 RepID=E0IDI6_9BACL|nr:MBL fold metallo-hydrolase [Paenibacillus curdlanolyticus]EFM09641.1 outer membrane protein RomA [Paenibacillus curdlanolyticus YK9]